MRKQGERFAVNMVIQGTAADVMKVAMVRAHNALTAEGLRTRLVLQIHDELLFEGPAEEAEQVRALAFARWRVPTRWIRRWRSRPASARTGCRPSDWHRLAVGQLISPGRPAKQRRAGPGTRPQRLANDGCAIAR